MVRHAVVTDKGLVREANEDDCLVAANNGLFVVADGMGGHVAGKVASELCVRTVSDYFEGKTERGQHLQPGEYNALSQHALELAESLLLANRNIYDESVTNRKLTGMGTTAVAVRIVGNRVAVAHAGDSRCYLFRDRNLNQITVDHSLSNFLLALGREIEARYAEQTMSNVIMRALGLEPDVAVDTKEFTAHPGDRLLLCSDGLSDLVPDAVLAQALLDPGRRPEVITEELLQHALDGGGRDNVTVLVVDILDEAGKMPKSAGRSGFSETLELPRAALGLDDAALGAGDVRDVDDDTDEVAAAATGEEAETEEAGLDDTDETESGGDANDDHDAGTDDTDPPE